MNEKKPQVKAPALETVTLIAEHTHAGKPCKSGDKIEVTARQKEFLQRHKRIATPPTIA